MSQKCYTCFAYRTTCMTFTEPQKVGYVMTLIYMYKYPHVGSHVCSPTDIWCVIYYHVSYIQDDQTSLYLGTGDGAIEWKERYQMQDMFYLSIPILALTLTQP